jgi:hypothetical protein
MQQHVQQPTVTACSDITPQNNSSHSPGLAKSLLFWLAAMLDYIDHIVT